MSFSLPINEFVWPVAAAVTAALIIYLSRSIAAFLIYVSNGIKNFFWPPKPVPVPVSAQAKLDWEYFQIAKTDKIAIVEDYYEKYKSAPFWGDKARQARSALIKRFKAEGPDRNRSAHHRSQWPLVSPRRRQDGVVQGFRRRTRNGRNSGGGISDGLECPRRRAAPA